MDVDAILDRRRLKRRLTFWRLAAVLAAVALVMVVARLYGPYDGAHVARLTIDGFIQEDPEREAAIRAAAADPDVRALLVRVNSPGGTTTGSEEVFHAIRHVAERKPVVAVIGTMGASGGYIVALAADHIVARETSTTGSIGVLFQTAEFSGLLEKLGVRSESLKSSPLKGEPSPLAPMSDEVREAMRAMVADSYDWFATLVQERRGFDDAQTRLVADGRIFTGRQARQNRLIDALGGEPTARHWLQAEHGIPLEMDTRELTWGDEEEQIAALLMHGLAGKLFSDKPLTLDGLISVWHPR